MCVCVCCSEASPSKYPLDGSVVCHFIIFCIIIPSGSQVDELNYLSFGQ